MRSQGRKSIQRSPETKGKQPFLFDVGELVDIAIAQLPRFCSWNYNSS